MIKKYNTDKYKFRELINNVFNINDLSKIHELRNDLLPNDRLIFDNESKTKFHQLFYLHLNNGKLLEFENSFLSFVQNEVCPLFKEDILHQYMPSFRIHLPGDKAIHKWHYDADGDHKHPDWEINFYVQLTDSFDTQTIWI